MAVDKDLGMIEQDIEAWVKQHVAFPDKSLHGPCSRVVLKHLNVDRKFQGDVRSFRNDLEEGAEDENIPSFVHKISTAAQGDADELNQGVQLYALLAYYNNDKGYVPRKYFRVAPSDVAVERELTPSESPTEKGLTSQLMRHVEAIQRTGTVATGHLFNIMQGEMRRIAEMNEKFAQQQIDFLVLMQELLDNSHERRLKEKTEESRLATKDSVLALLSSLVPVIINRVAGKPVVPEQNRSLMLMSNLLENLEPAQQSAFFESLTTPQKIALSEVLSEYEKSKDQWSGKKDPLRQLVSKSGLPATKPKDDGDNVLDPEPSSPSILMSLRERTKLLAAAQASDPKIADIERAASSLTSRFKDMLKNPEEGKPK